MKLSPGARLGPYEIQALLGVGGMGEVYRARDTRLDRDVAIKVLPALFAADPDRLARFEREAKTLASLNHPNIAHLHGLEEDCALVMELVEGEDLSQRIAAGAIPIDEAILIARQIAEALEAAHDQGVIHRDLKPANVKLRADGTVKVLDFGLAKALGPESAEAANNVSLSPTFTSPAMTQVGVILGTAAYMAPEQARGKPADRRVDIWAFGCVLYEMLTAHRPFEGDTVSDLIAAVIKERVALERLPGDVPIRVRMLISRCLEKDARQRLRDIGEARILLSAPFADSEPAPLAAPAKSRRTIVALAALLALALAALTWQLARVPRADPIVVTSFDLALPGDTELNVNFVPKLTVSADGSMVAFAAVHDGESHLYIRERNDVAPRRLPGTNGGNYPAFSPDGSWLAFFAQATLKKVPLEGPPVVITKVTNDARGLAWIDATSLVYSPGATSGLLMISADGGPPKSITEPDPEQLESHRWPYVMPGARAILYTSMPANRQGNFNLSTVKAVNLATGERRAVVQGAGMAIFVSDGHLLFTRGGTLHAVPFDQERLATTGTVVPVLQDVVDTRTGAAHVSVGGDGSLAYIPGSRSTLRVVAWLEADGTAHPVDLAPAEYNDLAVSPDGTRIAYSQPNNGIWVHDVQRKSTTRVTTERNALTPVWSPDGTSLYYIVRSGATTTLLRKPSDASRPAESMAIVEGTAFLGQVATDEATALINLSRRVAGETAHSDIVRVRLAAGSTAIVTPTEVEASAAQEAAGNVSPDGRWMAYQSNENGTRAEIYVRELSAARRRWQISNSGGEEPHWSPDGRRLYYREDDSVFAVAVAGGNAFTASSPQMVFRGVYDTRNDGPSYTVDRSSGRVLMLRPETGEQPRHQIRMVLNWFGELTSKLRSTR